ncbi:molybdopterin-guanine dinucleotide biosynthesis protein B [Magnetospira sp. QH-2]|uniref:molybdopterin-guanine dinucleotide biosynthesis protein B n=1 Tax=Magnetospira sp. (strain QH-2) TaxID=1288970 RepID=UPI0003E81247|nr:molybdopterin-guanine dinucleotide biosynthesis protein B [Magnetospira sp. QH-2]CCQ74863.1 molybdopterin-guanine dinucleotide biosynthesis protein B [Magnetospira sp. QH-2]
MKAFGLIGWSGSGKTTLIAKLLPALIARGHRVSTIKHTHHKFDLDTPGKDSYRHREAGATEVMVASSQRWTLMHELRNDPEPDMTDLLARMAPVDLVIVEGFKSHAFPKMEIHRPATGKPLRGADDPTVVAVASDAELDSCPLPVINLNDVDAIATFIETHMELIS